MWFLILMSLIAVGPIIYGIMMLRHKLCGHESGVYPIPTCIWFVYGALMKQGSSLNPDTGAYCKLLIKYLIIIIINIQSNTINLKCGQHYLLDCLYNIQLYP